MGASKGDNGSKNHKGILSSIKAYLGRDRLGELLVMRGAITPEQLKFALGRQKEDAAPLGEIFLKHSIISKNQLRFILGRQLLIRSVAGGMFFMFTVVNINGKKAKADIMDVPARISIATPEMSKHFTQVSAYPALFGADEKRSRNLKPFTKWTSMFDRFDRELKSGASNQVIKDWQRDLSKFEGRSIRDMAEGVNKLVNSKRYITDNRNWGKSDYWATPVEFLKRGGDCEDFAITKYTALRMLGVPENRMRIAIVHDNVKNIPHAILVVYSEDGAVILDNQSKRMLDGERTGRYRPIFSINRTAWWMHTAPSTTVLASAR